MVDKDPATTTRANLSPDQKPLVEPLDSRVGQQLNQRLVPFQIKEALDRRPLRPGAEHIWREACALKQAEGIDDDRLSRSGLTAQEIESGLELKLKSVDQRQIVDIEKLEHEYDYR